MRCSVLRWCLLLLLLLLLGAPTHTPGAAVIGEKPQFRALFGSFVEWGLEVTGLDDAIVNAVSEDMASSIAQADANYDIGGKLKAAKDISGAIGEVFAPVSSDAISAAEKSGDVSGLALELAANKFKAVEKAMDLYSKVDAFAKGDPAGLIGPPGGKKHGKADAPSTNASWSHDRSTVSSNNGECFIAGTPVALPEGEKAIEEIKLGDRVLTGVPGLPEGAEGATEITRPEEWRAYHCRLDHGDGTWTQAALLRPATWTGNLRTAQDDGSRWLWLDLPEFDARGGARVETVTACPPIASGKGRVVTSLFHHSRSDRVLALSLKSVTGAGEERADRLGVTRGHPFWSRDRGGWVRAGELRPGENLLGGNGLPVTVESIGEHPAAATYNFEVEADHAYRVGVFGTLVHNLSPIPNEGGKQTGKPLDDRYTEEDLDGLSVVEGKTQSRDWRVEKLETYEFDPRQPAHVRGWLKNERRRTDQGRQDGARNPPGYQQAHNPGKPAREGYDYNSSDLNLKANNDLATTHGL